MASEPDEILEALKRREDRLLGELDRVRRALAALTGADTRPVTAPTAVTPSRPVGFGGGEPPSPVMPPRIRPRPIPNRVLAETLVEKMFKQTNEFVEQLSKTGRVREIVTRYLTAKGTRATSGELLPVLQEAGLDFGTEAPQSKLAAFLANIKEFNNVKGEGYGLASWPLPDSAWKTPGDISLSFGDDD
jgi:hypothetical protein